MTRVNSWRVLIVISIVYIKRSPKTLTAKNAKNFREVRKEYQGRLYLHASKGLFGRCDCLLDIFFRMTSTEKCGFELRRRQVNSSI